MSEEENIPNQKSEDSPDSHRDKKTEVKKEMNEQLITKQPETSNQQPAFAEASGDKQATENMETHAYHLHKVPGKKWTHYLFEFLMLFLAVFTGFLAENWREHIAQHQRAKEYAKALLEDYAADTTEILDVIREDKIVLTCFDSIRSVIHNYSLNNKVPGSFYYYCNIGTASPAVVWTDATITQITQSGNLRYFTNLELVKKISYYYSSSRYITDLNNIDKRFREKSMELKSKVLDNYFFSQYSRYPILDWPNIPDSLMKIQLPIHDPNLLNEFANSLENRRANLGILIKRVCPAALDEARELMELLKREYHLE